MKTTPDIVKALRSGIDAGAWRITDVVEAAERLAVLERRIAGMVARRLIVTHHARPPIPTRDHDWVAYRDGDDEDTGKYGWGPTEAAALAAMIANEEEEAS